MDQYGRTIRRRVDRQSTSSVGENQETGRPGYTGEDRSRLTPNDRDNRSPRFSDQDRDRPFTGDRRDRDRDRGDSRDRRDSGGDYRGDWGRRSRNSGGRGGGFGGGPYEGGLRPPPPITRGPSGLPPGPPPGPGPNRGSFHGNYILIV